MNDNRLIATIFACGSWGRIGQKLILDHESTIEVRDKRWLVVEQGLIQKIERLPGTNLVRATVEWPDDTRVFVDSESTMIVGLAPDCIEAGYVKADALPSHPDLKLVFCIVIDPGTADEVLALCTWPWPLACDEDSE